MLAKVFNKGQVVIPARLRRKYKINIGDKVNIIEEDDGIKIVPVESFDNVAEELAGVFSDYADREIDKKGINEATEEYLVESVKDEVY
ncbi:AbrB/MazE/SpoVT family DNA-binding domain-containing protein [Hippea sp. KM1]|uniref:AbrB/MazE/SpoVT family DNA-binding domain-containing protein n=1 Tax=Hippea sp. KM1 TaxID=944481 RepID=UPI00046CBD46|nr:AbrB/MazE/SpoVT family DNA-binding domain-containing protein [Hippea sp. KM1]